MTEVVVTTGTVRRAKLQSNRHRQQTNTQFFTGRMPFLSPNQQCQSIKGKPLYTTVMHVYVSVSHKSVCGSDGQTDRFNSLTSLTRDMSLELWTAMRCSGRVVDSWQTKICLILLMLQCITFSVRLTDMINSFYSQKNALHSVVFAVVQCLSVRLSVTRQYFVSKRLNLSLKLSDHPVTPSL